MTKVAISALQSWVGKQETRCDRVTEMPVAGFSAAMDYARPRARTGEILPPLWHWLYFLATPAASEIDVDGHAKRGGFLPPVPLPRRMWAGSVLDFESPLRVGDEITRISTIKDISLKQGASGQLVFVTLEHEIFSGQCLAIREQQNLVYREAATTSTMLPAKPAPAEAQWSRQITPDPVLLFRYSALTFNSHRIHYDRDYATGGEGYAGLVVQGPLMATLLLDLLYREMPEVLLASFQFRGIRPMLDTGAYVLQGRCDSEQVELWVVDASGGLVMSAQGRVAK
ncbi:MAG: acyl-CoA dehydrogenase [Halieaceae bacterium]|jgi:3-methylfumaryl-CoA hydratase|nr:acyl-CoA dehydrogenase [Halieaceae bacterium]